MTTSLVFQDWEGPVCVEAASGVGRLPSSLALHHTGQQWSWSAVALGANLVVLGMRDARICPQQHPQWSPDHTSMLLASPVVFQYDFSHPEEPWRKLRV